MTEFKLKMKNLFTERLSKETLKLSKNQQQFYKFAQNLINVGVIFRPARLSDSFGISKEIVNLIDNSTKYIASPKIGTPISFKSLSHIQELMSATRILAQRLGDAFRDKFNNAYSENNKNEEKKDIRTLLN